MSGQAFVDLAALEPGASAGCGSLFDRLHQPIQGAGSALGEAPEL